MFRSSLAPAALLVLFVLAPHAHAGDGGTGSKPGAAAKPPAARTGGAPAAGIHGKWRDESGAVVEFRLDGTGSNRRGAFRYMAKDGELVFNDGATLLVFGYRLEGDRLVVESLGQQRTFTRAGAGTPVASSSGGAGPRGRVVVNGTALSDADVARLEQAVHVRAIPGRYWYDPACGAWGVQGGPTVGFLPAGLSLGGRLRPDASGGGTHVFINGRELHPIDVAVLQRITIVQPGRYWVDAMGNCGYEGNPMPLINLVQRAEAANARSGGAYHSRNDYTGIGSGGDGRTSYVMGKDWSVIIGE